MKRNHKITELLCQPALTLSAISILLPFIAGHHKCFAQEKSPASLSGFDSSEIFDIRDGLEFADDDKVLLRMLYRVCQVSDDRLLKYSEFTENVGLDEVRSSPRDFRCYVFGLAGRIKMVQSVGTPVDDEDSPFTGVNLAHLIDESGAECVIALPVIRDPSKPPSIPPRWPIDQAIDQPVSIHGFFTALRNFSTEKDATGNLNTGLNLENSESLLFVARQLEWFPNTTSTSVEVSDSELLLAKRGVDINRLETIRANIGGNISKHESASFYQMLAATREIQVPDLPKQKSAFTEYLQNPLDHQANVIGVSGNVRQVTKILVDDKSVQTKLGSEHYYQLDLLIPLNNQKIVIKPPESATRKNSQSKNIELENRFPVVVCVVSLPVSESEIMRQQVKVDGFLFKLWNYDSELTNKSDSGMKQMAPLIIGLTPEIIPIPPDYFGHIVAVTGLLVLVGLVTLFWYMQTQDDHSSTRRDRDLPDQIEIPDGGQL